MVKQTQFPGSVENKDSRNFWLETRSLLPKASPINVRRAENNGNSSINQHYSGRVVLSCPMPLLQRNE